MSRLLPTTLITFAAAMLLAVLAGFGDWSATALLLGMSLVAALYVTLLVRGDRAHHE